MAVPTVSRQQGSGGSPVARPVANELGFRLLDRELVDAVAERAGVRSETARFLDERAHGWAYGLIYSIQGAAEIDRARARPGASPPDGGRCLRTVLG